MPVVKFGIPTRSLGLPLRRALAAAGETGADGVEIDLRTELPLAEVSQTAIRELRRISGDLGLQIGIANYPTRRGFHDPAELERRLEGTQRAMQAAWQLGARVLVTRLGTIPPESEPSYTTLLESLEWMAAAADRAGVQLALEWGDEAEPMGALLAKLQGGTLGASFEPARLVGRSESPEQALEALAPYIVHVRATDAIRDLRDGRAVEVELGRGSVEFDRLAGQLEGLNFRGWITAGRGDSTYPLAQLTAAVSYLRNVMH